MKEWDVFICHASDDKDEFVRPFVEALKKQDINVWFDEVELNVGDSLRRRIDEGLRKSRYGIVILSNSFFNKQWPQTELDGLAARPAKGKNVILPIWHNVTREQVAKYSLSLSDRFALNTSDSIPSVVSGIIKVLKKPPKQESVLSEQNSTSSPSLPKLQPRPARLCDRLTENHWLILEQAAIRAVTAGGLAAMSYYRQPLNWPSYLRSPDEKIKNPSTIADLEATAVILQIIDSYLSRPARKLNCSLIFLGEETEYEEWLKKSYRKVLWIVSHHQRISLLEKAIVFV